MKNLKNIRESTGISQKEFAKLCKIAPSTYNQYETGKREPDIKTLIEIADKLNCSIDSIVGRIINTHTKSNSEMEINEQEKTLLENFRSTTEQGKQRMIQSILNIYDETEKKNTSTNTKHSS